MNHAVEYILYLSYELWEFYFLLGTRETSNGSITDVQTSFTVAQ